MFFEKKYYIQYVKRQENGYNKKGRPKRYRPNTEIEVIKKKGLYFDSTKGFITKRLKTYYYIDIDEGQLLFEGKQEIDKKKVKELFKTEGLRQLTVSSLGQGWKMSLMGIIVGAFAGFFAGAFIIYMGISNGWF